MRGLVHPNVLERAALVSLRLKELGVPRALIGGLAAGVHGHAHVTGDVDFLVSSAALDGGTEGATFRTELFELAELGAWHLIVVPDEHPWLEAELSLSDGVPIVSLPALIATKLLAYRYGDRADIQRLLVCDDARIADVCDYLAEHAPALLCRFGRVVADRDPVPEPWLSPER